MVPGSEISSFLSFGVWLISLSGSSGFILVVACVRTPFLLGAESHAILCPFVSGRTLARCFHVLVIVSNAAATLVYGPSLCACPNAGSLVRCPFKLLLLPDL